MRKDNRKVLSPSDLIRGSRLNNKAIMFDVDSRVKPENDRRKKEPENDSGGNENGCGWKWRGAAVVVAISVVFCLCAGKALAQCAVPPTCESLGYNLKAADCEGKRALKCPFDASKVFCSQTKYEGIAVGSIYYSDGTISDSVIAGKTPVGVVAYIKDKGGLVISLEENSAYWSTPNYTNLACLTDFERSGASGDINGANNTQCIMSEKSTGNSYPAASYCNSYKPVSSGKGSSGWYLPAAGEVKMLSMYYTALNISLQRLSKTQLSSNYYWSSSECGYRNAWYVRPSDGDMGNGSNKDDYKGRVRCVLAF